MLRAWLYLLVSAEDLAAVRADRAKFPEVWPLGDWRAYMYATAATGFPAPQ